MLTTMDTVQRALLRFNAHFPEAARTPDVRNVIAGDFYEAVKYWDDDLFREVCRYYLKSGKYFPKIADLYEAFTVINQNYQPQKQKALPEPQKYTDDRKSKHLQCARLISLAFSRKISFQEAVDSQLEILGLDYNEVFGVSKENDTIFQNLNRKHE